MAHITLNYLSKTLGMHQTINVILPEDKVTLIQMKMRNH